MKTVSERKVRQWSERNVDIKLDQVSAAEAGAWLGLAEEQTWTFFRLAEHVLKLRRKKGHLPSPSSRKEVTAFLLEFRLKVQLANDQIQNLPKVPFFDFGGEALFHSEAFSQAKMLYGDLGGAA